MKKIFMTSIFIFLTLVLVSCKKEDDTIKVGMDLRYPPFETTNQAGSASGISVDIAEKFGAFINKKVKIVPMEFGNLIIALQTGEIDIVIASMSITDERKVSVDFTAPYFYFKIISLLNKDFATRNNINEDSKVSELLAIEDANYIGLTSQVSSTIPESLGKVVKKSTNITVAIEEVSQGTSDILLMSASPVVNGYKSHDKTTIVMWDPFVSSPIGMGVKKGNKELLEKANEFIKTFNEKDGIYDFLKNKWDETITNELGRYGLDFYIQE